MQRAIISLLFVLMLAGITTSPVFAAVLVQSANGTYVTKSTITAANTAADAVGKRIKVTGAITMTANLALATDRQWDFTDALITTTGYTLTCTGADITLHESKQVFAGSGTVTGLNEARPELWAKNTTPGTTNMTAALTSFFNAINHPGGHGYLKAEVYAISSQLPTITQSSVTIEGAGNGRHDVSPAITGSEIRWVGAAGGTMQVISPIEGAGNGHLTNLKIKGITYNANSTAAYGIKIYSVWNSDIDVAALNATTAGGYFSAVATLGEAADFQKNMVHFVGRQIEAPAGVGLILDGTSSANVSLNDFWIDIQHKNNGCMYWLNDDNNNWHTINCFRAAGGTATDSVSVFGGATAGQRSRSERIYYLSATAGLHAYGTSGAEPSSAYAATNILIYALDKENGTPDPSIEPGASVYWQNDNTPFGDTPWVSFTPTITAAAGAFTTVSATGKYLKRGEKVYITIDITCTDIGTASTYVIATLPFTEALGVGWVLEGKNNATLAALTGHIGGTSSQMEIMKYDGTFPAASGEVLTITGFYAL